ncbi:ubiquitin carboxyl-terminal hydrolase 2-like [Macrosteles quadrilineatus]|uniref:ubiquitin carboxyl-terminal hydrolase 2-like n=1 Tax=Macrosteles quadrilineatus TaxID=74068 RepID=UPI0023E18502|nr:ubiquitin carboxyl-terminal hydrolase 2-like [Macrosteles quadrilineatus]XP_054279587.1 ubiquitin carboxyl-terminal hydrolase 2-like [Macrosteles quadrilineatus]XP_054279612.1 ubiquitin carboxyl-terminal hydrolase 2-like [Macrosteles quadrilineatus]
MPVSVTRSYHSESRYGSSYSPSAYSSSYRSPLSTSTYRSTYTSSYRSTSGLDDSYTSSRDKSDTNESYSSSLGKSRDYTKSRSLSNAETALKGSSLTSRRPSATSSTYTSPVLDISKYSPSNYVTGSARSSSISSTSSAGSTTSRPPRGSFSSLRDPSYTPSTSLRSSRYTEQESDRELSSPSKSSKTSHDQKGLTGLNNIGNTCFLNSIVQCLSNTRVIKEYILSDEYLNEIRPSVKSALMKRFAELIKNLWQGDQKSLSTHNFKLEVDIVAPRFTGYLQQDAQEFLRYLLEGIHNEINRITSRPKPLTEEIDDDLDDSQKALEVWKRYLRLENSKIVDTFGGLLKSILECTHCSHKSTTFEPFWDLSLPIPDTLTHPGKLMLSHCFDLFTKEEVLDGDEMPTCSKCKTRRKCKKRFVIQKFPEVLVIHLKRFSLGSRARKVDSSIEFPVTKLDMGPYSAESQYKNLLYDLYAVVNHNGTCYTGHYTAYCRHPYSHEWYIFNDRSVLPMSGENMPKRDAYVLFYEQTASTNL